MHMSKKELSPSNECSMSFSGRHIQNIFVLVITGFNHEGVKIYVILGRTMILHTHALNDAVLIGLNGRADAHRFFL